MQAIFDFFAGIGKIIEGICTFFVQMIGELVWLSGELDGIRDTVISFIQWLPPVVYTCVMLVVGVAIVYKVLGREG